jgi:hypothetical protein
MRSNCNCDWARGVYFDVLPQEHLASVRDGIRRGMAGLIPLPKARAPYWPHLAVAYATGGGPIESG